MVRVKNKRKAVIILNQLKNKILIDLISLINIYVKLFLIFYILLFCFDIFITFIIYFLTNNNRLETLVKNSFFHKKSQTTINIVVLCRLFKKILIKIGL